MSESTLSLSDGSEVEVTDTGVRRVTSNGSEFDVAMSPDQATNVLSLLNSLKGLGVL